VKVCNTVSTFPLSIELQSLPDQSFALFILPACTCFASWWCCYKFISPKSLYLSHILNFTIALLDVLALLRHQSQFCDFALHWTLPSGPTFWRWPAEAVLNAGTVVWHWGSQYWSVNCDLIFMSSWNVATKQKHSPNVYFSISAVTCDLKEEYICGCHLFRLWPSGLQHHCGQILTFLMYHTASTFEL
jgi:hypothetical protein